VRVLVIDDSHSMGEVLASALEEEGCTVLVARSVQDGLALARHSQPEVITMRTRSCGLAGLADDEAVRGVPIIALGRGIGGAERVIGEPFYVRDVVSAVFDVVKGPTTVRPATRP
jgi:DNA-binding response OmpR family regulator